MKFYSEVLNKTYDTAEDCQKAESDYMEEQVQKILNQENEKKKEEEKAAKRAAAEKKLNECYDELLNVKQECRKKIHEAEKNYNEELKKFVKEYHTYRWSSDSNSKSDIPNLFLNLFNL